MMIIAFDSASCSIFAAGHRDGFLSVMMMT
jgi:hypothetical protein